MSPKKKQEIRKNSTEAALFGIVLLLFIWGGVHYQVHSERRETDTQINILPRAKAETGQTIRPFTLDGGQMVEQAQKKDWLAKQALMLLDMKKKDYQLRGAEYLREGGTSRGAQRGRQITLESTGYTCGPESTGKHPSASDYCQTASGYRLKPGDKVVAMGKKYPFGTTVMIPGYGVAIVRDRGGAVSDHHIDLYFEKVEDALQWGRRIVAVTIP